MEKETNAMQIRLPAKIYKRLSVAAKKARRSINSEIITNLEEYFAWQDQWEETRKKNEERMTPEQQKILENLIRRLDHIEAYAKAHPEEFP